MNRKGQITMGIMLMTFIGIIVALVIFGTAIVPQVGTSTTLSEHQNHSFAFSDGAITEIPGVLWSNVIVHNATTGEVIEVGNYSIENKVLSIVDGRLTARINTTGDAAHNSGNWNISGTVEGDQYIGSSGARSITLLIVIFSALAIAVVALEPTLRSRVIENFGK